MAENIYNLFLFFENERCSTVGYVVHQHDGSDEKGCEFLKASLEDDLSMAKKITLTKSFTLSEHNAKCRLGEGHHLYDEVFATLDAGPAPLFVATPARDGKLFYDYSSQHGPLDMKDVAEKLGWRSSMVDWLDKYTNERGIDLSQLIHDDYFLAIKLTFNQGLYVSAMKLLVSCIDSLAYIEYGNVRTPHPFTSWLDTYADLSPLGITSAELWELRNGILHMTNINSEKVRNSKVRRISFRVGGTPDYPRVGKDNIYFFDFYGLILAFAEAQGRWLESYNSDRDKFAKFVERYDESISDSRVAFTHVGEAGYTENL
ncbi:MAG: hypothetical protein AB7U71_10495 [Comamonas sp.]